jgi:CBS domain-containing membrane protein
MAGLRVNDLMTRDPVAVAPETDLREASDLMDSRQVRHLPVVDRDGHVTGLLSHRDLVRRATASTEDQLLTVQEDILRSVRVRDIMTAEVERVEPDSDATIAGQIMLDNKYGCLPVTEDERLVGILTEADFVRHLVETA